MNSTNLVFEIGDQILDINGIGIYSTEDITDVMGKTGIGNVVEFKIKRPKKVKRVLALCVGKYTIEPICDGKEQAFNHPWGGPKEIPTYLLWKL